MTTKQSLQHLPEAKASHAWEQMSWIWSAIFLAALLVPLILVFFDPQFSNSQRFTATAIIGLMFGFHFAIVLIFRRLPDFRERLYLSIPYMLVIFGLWYALIAITEVFYLGLAGLFSQLFWIVPIRWAALLALLLASLAVYDQTLGSGRPFDWWLALLYTITTGGGIALGRWLDGVIRQSVERRDLIAQLEATQSELAAAERRAGMLAERQRLAHEIHDTLAQGFISVIMHLEAAEQELDADAGSLSEHINQAKEAARYNLQEARRVVSDLRPEQLENHALPAAIARTVQRWSNASRIPATMQTTGSPLPLHPELDVTLLRATQEALANVRKHAQANNVTVTLSYMDDMVLLDVQDDGVGLNGGTPSPYSSSFGLKAMRTRVAEFGGEVLLESEPDGGTTLVVQIPISEQ